MNGPNTVNLTLGPRSLERPADAGYVVVAGVDGEGPAMVDGGGLIEPGAATGDSGWSLDWWVGADDRWHIPAREPSVRQSRIGHGPIIETAVRVPSGDVTSTAYPALAGRRPVVVVEVMNQSPVPVALAIAVRPYGLDGGDRPDPPDRLSLKLDGEVISVGGRPGVVLPRRPNEAGVAADGDLFDVVSVGGDLGWDGEVVGPDVNAVCLFPLPHRTSLRFVVLPETGDDRVDGLSLDGLPDAESVARGWSSVIDRAAGFDFADDGVTALAGAARARSVVASADLGRRLVDGQPGAGLILEGLAIGGHRVECRQALAAVAKADLIDLARPESGAGADDSSSIVAGIGLAAELLASVSEDDGDLIEDLLEAAVHLTTLVERAGDDPATARARLGLAKLAAAAGQPEAAAELVGVGAGGGQGRGGLGARLRRLVGGGQAVVPPTDRHDGGDDDDRVDALAGLTARAERASAAGSWGEDDPVEAARFWVEARRLLLVEDVDRAAADDGVPVVELLPAFPTAWLGGVVEVHRAPVAGFEVSFAIRWHGYRPALLWEITGGGDETEVPRLVCPSLDPSWRSSGRSGETLLAGIGTELPPAPSPGQSFQ